MNFFSSPLRLADRVEKQIAGERVFTSLNRFERRLDRRGVLSSRLDRDGADVLGIGDAAVADRGRVFRNRVHDGGGAWEGLDFAREILVAEDVLLEEDVGTGIILAAVGDDPLVRSADIAPVGDPAGVNPLQLRPAKDP